MLKLLTLLAVIGLSGCTQGQRFMLMKNVQLDECAMKRMSETKISGQIGTCTPIKTVIISLMQKKARRFSLKALIPAQCQTG